MDVPTDDGFVAFYRRYARTGVHAATTAALTALGTLTIVHRGFAVAALAAYAIPPVALYVRGSGSEGVPDDAPGDDATTAASEEGTATSGETTVADDPAADAPVIEWSAARAPTDVDLADAAVTDETAVAVGEGGTVLEREDGREPWAVTLPDGPAADGAALQAADTTPDGIVWVAGDGGAVGRRDASGRWVDHSAPAGDTNNLVGVAVTGQGEAETVLLVDGGGSVRRGRYHDSTVAWDDPVTPGSGSSIAGVVLQGDTGYVVDTAGDAFRTTDGGRTFTSLDLDASGTPTAVAPTDQGVAVATTAGVVHLHEGSWWTPERVADGELAALAAGKGSRAVAAADRALHLREGPGDWGRVVVPAGAPLDGVAVGTAGAVAVGADGTIVERWPRAED